MPVLRGERERAMARVGICRRKQAGGIVGETKPGSGGKIDARATVRQNLGGIAHAEGQRGR